MKRDTTKSPRASVIVIFLNAERFFEEAIESVLAQDFDDWELLLVDDGSTDGSTDVAAVTPSATPTGSATSRIRDARTAA